MKLSFTTMATPGIGGVEAIRSARRYGYHGVDLRVSDMQGELSLESPPSVLREIRDAFATEGIASPSLLCYNATGNAEDPASWEQMETSLLNLLELAEKVGSESIRMFAGHIHQAADIDLTLKRIAESTRNALERNGGPVRIVIQNHAGHCSVTECGEIIRRAASPRLGLVFSPDHCTMVNEDLTAAYAIAKQSATQLYIADATPVQTGDKKEFRSVLPGKGIVPLREAYLALGGHSFQHWISFKWEKIWNPELEDYTIALPYFVRYASSTLA